jgi:hypothetical protein
VSTAPAGKSGRTVVRGKGWKKASSIAAEKFDVVAAAVLKVLPSEPIRFTELVRRVGAELPKFSGSVAWYTIVCARELEVRGLLRRTAKPVLYGRPLAVGRARRSPSPPRA